MQTTLKRMNSERGAVIIQVAICLLFLLAFASFVVDYGFLWTGRAQAQTAGALCMRHIEEYKEPPLVYFMAIDKARFRRPVVPGDTVHYHVQKIRNRGRVWRFKAQALVHGALVAEAEVSAVIVDEATAAETIET